MTEYIPEKKTIYFIDIDETLFHQKNTLVYVKDWSGKVVKALTNEEFNDYVLPPGYTFDHSDFRSGQSFVENAEKIPCTIEWLKQLIIDNKNLSEPDLICILTARGDFDDKNLVLDFFDKQGIPIRRYNFVQFVRTGNINEKIPTSMKKAVVGLWGLINNQFKRFVMVDDSITNLEHFYDVKACSVTQDEQFDIIHVIHDKVDGKNCNYRMIEVNDKDAKKYIEVYKAKRVLAKWGVEVTDKSVEHIEVGKRTKKEAEADEQISEAHEGKK